MASKSLRRLAKDHGALHNALPPNYLFAPSKEDSYADLTSLSILLAGPEGTPFSPGVFDLHLNIPATYPQSPPTATFRTKIFHPNVDPSTGAVCVDTLKRDWKPELTLKDVLVTITCLLVCPNPASALNAEAGQLMEEDFKEYERKAMMWSKMHAAVPVHLRGLVEEARNRGEVDGGARVRDARATVVGAGKGNGNGNGKRRKEEDIQVLVQEVEAENQDEHSNAAGKGKAFSSATPDIFAGGQASARMALGLGLDVNMDSSVIMETPTQAPLQRRRKKTHVSSMPVTAEESTHAPGAPSFSTVLSTPIPRAADILAPPDAKRLRVTPPSTKTTTPRTHHSRHSSQTSDPAEDIPTWSRWHEMSPKSSTQVSRSAKKKREINEYGRMKAAGFSIEKYNSGRFGPRRGIERL